MSNILLHVLSIRINILHLKFGLPPIVVSLLQYNTEFREKGV